jgi:hypothetical protein
MDSGIRRNDGFFADDSPLRKRIPAAAGGNGYARFESVEGRTQFEPVVCEKRDPVGNRR